MEADQWPQEDPRDRLRSRHSPHPGEAVNAAVAERRQRAVRQGKE